MSSPFDPPQAVVPLDGDRPPLVTPLQDPHVVAAAALLGIYGLFDCGIAALLPVSSLFSVVASVNAPGGDVGSAAMLGAVTLLEGICIGGVGLLFLGGAAGMVSGRKWGWGVALAASALWMSSPCCIPFGAYCLFALLRKRVRVAFGIV